MKKKVLFASLLMFFGCLFTIISVKDAEAGVTIGGKWVAEYGGDTKPFRCACVTATTVDCVSGDTTKNLSKCE